jgi:glycosyltransferase involved in cell wall biosynthesis
VAVALREFPARSRVAARRRRAGSRSVNVTLIAPPWYPVPPSAYGGIELVVALLAQKFERCGHDVTVLANGDSRPAGALRSPLRSPPSNGMIGNPFIEARHALGAYAEVRGADIIHDHSGAIGPALASRDPSLPPVVHTLHGPWTPAASEFYRFVGERIHLVAISAAQRDANPNVRYAGTIHNGIDIDMYPMNEGPRSDGLVYIGRANPGKNPDGAIRVARASGRELKLVVKRHEPEEQEYWKRVIAPLLGSDVEVLEDIDHRTKVQLLQQAHAMLFPIDWPEPFGLVMVEAMACGTPVVTRPRGAATELVEHGRSGFLCETETQMVDAVDCVQYLDRTYCRQRTIERFSATKMAAAYEQLFVQLLEKKEEARAAVSRCSSLRSDASHPRNNLAKAVRQ